MIKTENPAGRLHSILSKLVESDPNSSMKEVWADALDIDRANEVEVLKHVFDIYQLSSEIRQLITLNPSINHDLYLASHAKLEQITSPVNFHKRWHQLSGALETDILTRLQFCAEELSRFYEEEKVSAEEIVEITAIVNLLFDELSKSSVDDITKLLLLEEVERIRSALSRYRIKGAKGVKEALQATLGAVIVNKDQLEKAAEEDPDVIKRLGGLLEKLDSFSSKALKIHKALSKPVGYILSLIDKNE